MKRTDKSIKSIIYKGLPEELAEKVLRADDEYRTNPLSLKPGGVDIVVEYTTDEVLLYDKIKHPDRYVKRILSFTTNAEISAQNIESLVQDNLKKVFVKDGVYIEIWDSSMSYDELITALRKYNTHNNTTEMNEGKVGFRELKLCKETLQENWTYIILGTYNGYTFLSSFRDLIANTLHEEDPFKTVWLLSKVTELKSKSEQRPFMVDLKEINDSADEILDDDPEGWKYKGNNTSRLRLLSDYIIRKSSDLIVFSENSNERVKLLRMETDFQSDHDFVYINGHIWSLECDDVILLGAKNIKPINRA